jgi:hypothetical protein
MRRTSSSPLPCSLVRLSRKEAGRDESSSSWMAWTACTAWMSCLAGQVQQAEVAAMALDSGADGGPVQPAHGEVSLPMAG